ncbi:Pimeloyl-ACP methyl ester carboxylesterase [Nocardiopsis flavescens]|uniref:Pimeloyl-ACP methyl ester carboxylesterase n=1 Tax=Nocardiopsis flavescens TaxID=758803 RepID=A0A1M6U743_9ACTN|nr:alpha/beta hydrolase [Nocardiopsis flavescens]SHK65095.1 Pimeloyl-ACP methyl ester carboxylesterase [Nocardiopsis flavescens]
MSDTTPVAGDEYTVPVAGGGLAVTRWGEGPGVPVLAVHGITANGHSFARLAAELAARGGPPLHAPDLRGRGASGALPGPHGLAAHADDLVAVLDRLGVERTVWVGHSMGAFVSCLAAVRHPDRVSGLLLVDGGHGLPAPAGTDIDSVLGPAMVRLRTTFASPDDYRAFWRRHPAFAGRWNPWVDAYILRDLAGTAPDLRSTCDEAAVRTDGAQVLADAEVLGAVHRLPVPARLLWAARGLMDEAPGLYTPERLAGLPDTLATVELPDDNHYTPLFSSTARLLAAQVHALVQETVQVQRQL